MDTRDPYQVYQKDPSDSSSGLGTRLTSTNLAALDSAFQAEYLIKMPAGTGPEGQALANSRVCVSPFDSGDSPNCESYPLGTKLNNDKKPFTGQFIPYDNNGNPIGSQTGVPCEKPDDMTPDYCSPWSDTYGFFFGDGYSHDVVLTVSEMNTETSLAGGYIKGASVFEHTYASSKKSVSEPYVAFFTGGNRFLELNNNKGGRFRLETSWPVGMETKGYYQG